LLNLNKEIKCGANETYDIRKSCVRTCENPRGRNVCQESKRFDDGCFCKDGYVRNKENRCILVNECPKKVSITKKPKSTRPKKTTKPKTTKRRTTKNNNLDTDSDSDSDENKCPSKK
jgi:hypothetical protein